MDGDERSKGKEVLNLKGAGYHAKKEKKKDAMVFVANMNGDARLE